MIRKKKGGTGREGGRFIAIPHVVLESPAYMALSHPAKALLLEFALQFHGDDNGRLLCSARHLRQRGWNSADVINRAKKELLSAGFIHETVKGHRPNKASWYAVTWQTLDRLQGYDEGAALTFERGAYRKKSLTPYRGVVSDAIAPFSGLKSGMPTPSAGAMALGIGHFPSPSNGYPLERPSVGDELTKAAAEIPKW